MYCFRIRLRLGPRVRVNAETTELLLSSEDADGGERVSLRSTTPDIPLAESDQLALRGGGYSSRDAAEAAAARWLASLRSAFAALRLGADFGLRGPRSVVTGYGLRMVDESSGRRALNDEPGILIFECEPEPVFVSVSAEALVGKPADQLVTLVNRASEANVATSEREELAFDLYSASFFEGSADARFVALMMALETLIEQEPRGERALEHIARLIEDTRAADDLPHDDRESLLGSLESLQTESVRRAGLRLARSLGDRRYMDESAPRFFGRCYEMRSALVHGHYPRPDPGEVGVRAAAMEQFVADLLSGPLLEAAS